MPFVYQGQLLVSYTLAPKHVVYQLQPSGLAERRFETDTSKCSLLSVCCCLPPCLSVRRQHLFGGQNRA